MLKFNMNQYIYVKLNEKGLDILNRRYGDLLKPEPETGYYKFQMWYFNHIFQEAMSIGQDPVVEGNNIYFDEKDLLEVE